MDNNNNNNNNDDNNNQQPIMDQFSNKYDILSLFEQRLIQTIDEIKLQSTRIKDLENELNRTIDDRHRWQQLYEQELDTNRVLIDSLDKKQMESKIAVEMQTIECREAKNLALSQLAIKDKQIVDLKQTLTETNRKCHQLQQLVDQKSNELQKQSMSKSAIECDIRQVRTKYDAIHTELKTVVEAHNQIKYMIASTDKAISGLRKQLNDKNEEIVVIRKDRQSIESQLSEMSAKTETNCQLLNEKDLHLLRVTQTNELLKQEINDLRDQLKQSMIQNESLTKTLTEFTDKSFDLMKNNNNKTNTNNSSEVETTVDNKPTVKQQQQQQTAVVMDTNNYDEGVVDDEVIEGIRDNIYNHFSQTIQTINIE
ncbi:protein hook homolog [Oppia nitens]|uniref:protein hook homolog n=1 Tax=Oppia nitens TaxID=1686743 RepID=UPI0023DBBDEC|nr:protein hook homolog [Oppia nitens]